MTIKLSETQKNFLLRLAKTDYELPPGGYVEAGRDASRWWRTARVLKRHGFVTTRGQHAQITDTGRRFANRFFNGQRLTIDSISKAMLGYTFWLDPNSDEAKIVNEATKRGYVRRWSHTQIEWTWDGFAKADSELK